MITQLSVLDFFVLNLLVTRDGEIIPVLLDLADRHKETFAFPIRGFLFLPVAVVLDDIRDIPLAIDECPLVVERVPVRSIS